MRQDQRRGGKFRILFIVVAGGFLLGVGAAGCREEDSARDIHCRDGVIEAIDQDAGRVALRYLNEKTRTEETIAGFVTEETEILVNGVLAGIRDLRVGEQIAVCGRVDKVRGGRRIVALKIAVERGERIDASSSPPSAAAGAEPT